MTKHESGLSLTITTTYPSARLGALAPGLAMVPPAEPICLSQFRSRVTFKAKGNRECDTVSPAGIVKSFTVVASDRMPSSLTETEAGSGTSGMEPAVEVLFEAFNQACDRMDVAAAQALLLEAKAAMSRNGQPAFKDQGDAGQHLVDAHFRLWELRHLVR